MKQKEVKEVVRTIDLDEIIRETEAAGRIIDAVVAKCHPSIGAANATFADSMLISAGIEELRKVIQQQAVKARILSLMNSRLGFLTDKSGKPNWKGEVQKPYAFDQIEDAVIDALINGYRLVGNEFNIIAGNFYAAKNGKERQVKELPGVASYVYTTTPAAFDPAGQDGVQYARVQCFATVMRNGETISFGSRANGAEDTLKFKIRVNKSMGEDAIVGKALSKLHGRVLSYLTGRAIPESTDLDGPEAMVANALPDLSAALRPKATDINVTSLSKYEALAEADPDGIIAAVKEAGLADVETDEQASRVLEAYEATK